MAPTRSGPPPTAGPPTAAAPRLGSFLLVGLVVMASLVVPPTASPARAGEISLRTYFNNVGIAQDPTSGADFDGVGYSYSALALLLEGVRGGETVTADGMSFTWPDTASGEPDNMAMNGQVVPLLPPDDATRLGFLGASEHGPVTTTVTLHYAFVDADGEYREESVDHPVTFSDWTLNAGGASAHATNTVAVEAMFRTQNSSDPELVATHVFATSIPVDPTMTLQSVEFPTETHMHLFGMTVL